MSRLLDACRACQQASVADKLEHAKALGAAAANYVIQMDALSRVAAVERQYSYIKLSAAKDARVAQIEWRVQAMINAAHASKDGQQRVFAAAILVGTKQLIRELRSS